MASERETQPASGTDRDWEVYKILVDEYRFQVTLNWQRSQYLLVLNLGLVGAGTALFGVALPIARTFTSVLFLVGFFVCIASIRVITIQHEYYRRTRARKTALEEQFGLEDKAPRPTTGMRGEKRGPRLNPFSANVNDLLRVLLVLLAAVDLGAAAGAFATVDDLRTAVERSAESGSAHRPGDQPPA